MNPAQTTPEPVRARRLPRGAGSRSTMSRRGSCALALLVSAQFVVMLDTSIVNVALPSIQSDLDLAPHTLSWVVNAYVLTFGGLLLLLGRVGGSALFTAGTLLAGAAGTEWGLLAGRVPQGPRP